MCTVLAKCIICATRAEQVRRQKANQPTTAGTLEIAACQNTKTRHVARSMQQQQLLSDDDRQRTPFPRCDRAESVRCPPACAVCVCLALLIVTQAEWAGCLLPPGLWSSRCVPSQGSQGMTRGKITTTTTTTSRQSQPNDDLIDAKRLLPELGAGVRHGMLLAAAAIPLTRSLVSEKGREEGCLRRARLHAGSSDHT
jgi:hypothetical protein